MKRSQKKLVRQAVTLGAFSLCAFVLIATSVDAQEKNFVSLVGLPGLETSDGTTLPEYINAVYVLTISLGAIYGVIRIALAGVKYSLSDVVTHKEDAKHDITGVLQGLAILLIPFIVLNTIYPGLTNLDVLKGAPKTELANPSQPSAQTAVTTLDNGSVQGKVSSAPTGTKVTTCGYQPDRGAGGCITEVQQSGPNCQTQRNECIEVCESKSGKTEDKKNGDNSGVIFCTFTTQVDQIPK